MTVFNSAIVRLAVEEIRLPLAWMVKWVEGTARGKRCPGGLDHMFLALILTCLFCLLQTLWAVKQGTIDKMTELMLGRISEHGAAGATLLPILFNGREGALYDEDIAALRREGLKVFANARVSPEDLSLQSELVQGLDAGRLDGRFVQDDDPVWRAAMPEGNGDRFPFIIVLNAARFRNSSVNIDKAAEAIASAYTPAEASAWRSEANGTPGGHLDITGLNTAWLKIRHQVKVDGTIDIQKLSTLLPVRVVARSIPGVRAPDFLVPMDLLIMLNNFRPNRPDHQLTPEQLNRRAGWGWYDDSRAGRQCNRVEAADFATLQTLSDRLVDVEGNRYGVHRAARIDFDPKLPEAFLLARAQGLPDVSRSCDPVNARTAADLTQWRDRNAPLLNDAYAYLPWEKRQQLPRLLDAINGGSSTLDIQKSFTDPTYQDYATRLLVLTSILEAARLPVAFATIGVLMVAAIGCLAIIISSRRSRYALLMSHGLSAWSLWRMLTLQLTFTTIVGSVVSFGLSWLAKLWINHAIVSSMMDMRVPQDLRDSLGDIIVVGWQPAVIEGIVAAAFLTATALVLQYWQGPWHSRDLGSHLVSG